MQQPRFRDTPARWEALAAAACALAMHAWLAWGLDGLLRGGSPTAPVVAPFEVLQVIWLAPRAMAPPPSAPVPRKRLQAVVVATVRPRIHDIPVDSAPVPAPPAEPLSAALVGQTRQWARQQAPLEFAGSDPLADRIAAIPGRPANRFRMRAPLSTADVVGFIGQTFGNGADPCVLNRADLAAYATGRDAKAMALAVDFDRRLCRP